MTSVKPKKPEKFGRLSPVSQLSVGLVDCVPRRVNAALAIPVRRRRSVHLVVCVERERKKILIALCFNMATGRSKIPTSINNEQMCSQLVTLVRVHYAGRLSTVTLCRKKKKKKNPAQMSHFNTFKSKCFL